MLIGMGTRAASSRWLIAMILLAACPGPTGDCDRDWECAGGETCANTHDCVPEGSTYPLRVTWTMAGFAADPQTCGLIDHLELRVVASASGDFAHFAPVPCDAGQFGFAKLPLAFDTVNLTAIAGGRQLEEVTAAVGPSTGTVSFDLRTAQPPALDAGMPIADAAPITDAAPLADADADAGVGD